MFVVPFNNIQVVHEQGILEYVLADENYYYSDLTDLAYSSTIQQNDPKEEILEKD